MGSNSASMAGSSIGWLSSVHPIMVCQVVVADRQGRRRRRTHAARSRPRSRRPHPASEVSAARPRRAAGHRVAPERRRAGRNRPRCGPGPVDVGPVELPGGDAPPYPLRAGHRMPSGAGPGAGVPCAVTSSRQDRNESTPLDALLEDRGIGDSSTRPCGRSRRCGTRCWASATVGSVGGSRVHRRRRRAAQAGC